METDHTQEGQIKKEQLKKTLIVLLIISGSFLDFSVLFFDIEKETWEKLHFLCRELRLLGAFILAFTFIPYKKIKTKTFCFMFIIWSSVIIVYNQILPNPNSCFFSIPLYIVYLWWLIRILFIPRDFKETKKQTKNYIKNFNRAGVTYNILLPVSTFRGLLQILFLPHLNPLYETRLLIHRNKMVGISGGKFIELPYEEAHINSLIDKNCKVVLCKKYSLKKVEKLIGSKAVLFFKDCRTLEM